MCVVESILKASLGIEKKNRKLFAISKWNWKRDKKDFCHT